MLTEKRREGRRFLALIKTRPAFCGNHVKVASWESLLWKGALDPMAQGVPFKARKCAFSGPNPWEVIKIMRLHTCGLLMTH